MNTQADHLNQTDEDMLADTVSDEALEAAAAMEKGVPLSQGTPRTRNRGTSS